MITCDQYHNCSILDVVAILQDESHVFQLVGQAKPHIMYLTGGDDLMPDVESLAVVPHIEEEEGWYPYYFDPYVFYHTQLKREIVSVKPDETEYVTIMMFIVC